MNSFQVLFFFKELRFCYVVESGNVLDAIRAAEQKMVLEVGRTIEGVSRVYVQQV